MIISLLGLNLHLNFKGALPSPFSRIPHAKDHYTVSESRKIDEKFVQVGGLTPKKLKLKMP